MYTDIGNSKYVVVSLSIHVYSVIQQHKCTRTVAQLNYIEWGGVLCDINNDHLMAKPPRHNYTYNDKRLPLPYELYVLHQQIISQIMQFILLQLRQIRHGLLGDNTCIIF